MIVGQYDIVILRDDHSTQILGWKEILLQHPIAYPTKTQVLHLSVHLLHLLPDIIAECFICRNRCRIKYTVWKSSTELNITLQSGNLSYAACINGINPHLPL